MKYQLIKNNEWKDLIINEEVRKFPISYQIKKIKEIITPEKKSSIKALSATKFGKYPFFNCSEKQTKFTNDFLVDGENIFITTGGDYLFTLYYNGKSAYSTDVWCGKTINDNALFINYYLKNNFNQNQIYFRGFKFKHLDKKGFNEMELAIPPVEVQYKISSVLGIQEVILSNITKLIEKNELIFNELSEKLLSGELRLEDINETASIYKNPNGNWKNVEINGNYQKIPKDWNVVKIKDSLNIVFGKRILKSNSSGNIPVFGGGGASFYTNLASHKNKWVIGRFALSEKCVRFIENDFWLLDSGFTFNTLENNENFLGYKLFNMQNYIYTVLARGGGQKNVDMNQFGETEIALPNQNQQIIIAQYLLTQEQRIQRLKNLLSKEKEKFQWLLDNLLSGKYLVEEI